MVSISKRMHVLKPKVSRIHRTISDGIGDSRAESIDTHLQLLSLRHGPGAAILAQNLPQPDSTTTTTTTITSSSPLPSASSNTHQQLPTLLRVRLAFPSGNGPASRGARGFWRNHLRRLKYHNPALPVSVDQNAEQGTEGKPGPAWRLFLDFEGDEKALRELATEPKNERFRELMEEGLRPRPIESESVEEEESARSGKKTQRTQTTPAPSSSSPSSSTSTIQPPPDAPPPPPRLISTRTVSLPVLNRPANTLWFWFQQRTQCIDVPETQSDKELAAELAEFNAQAEEDRQRVKKSRDAIKAKEEMLKLARREVDRMKEEED